MSASARCGLGPRSVRRPPASVWRDRDHRRRNGREQPGLAEWRLEPRAQSPSPTARRLRRRLLERGHDRPPRRGPTLSLSAPADALSARWRARSSTSSTRLLSRACTARRSGPEASAYTPSAHNGCLKRSSPPDSSTSPLSSAKASNLENVGGTTSLSDQLHTRLSRGAGH